MRMAAGGGSVPATRSRLYAIPDTPTNTIYYTDDGSTWSSKGWPTSAQWNAIATDGTTYIIVGNSDKFIQFGNFTPTYERSAPASENWTGVAWNGAVFIAVSANGRVATSPTGETWTQQGSNTALPNAATIAARPDGRICVTSNDVNNSVSIDNGVSWATAAELAPGELHKKMIWSTPLSKFLLVMQTSNTYDFGLSSDGSSWTQYSSAISSTFQSIAGNGSIFVAVAYFGIASSVDGQTWTSRDSTAISWTSVSWNGVEFIALGDDFYMGKSTDGINWTINTTGPTTYTKVVGPDA